jgi:hypothetical protein
MSETKTAECLPGPTFQLVPDSQDIRETLQSIGKSDLADKITGLLVKVGDAEYLEVWATESSRPYSIYAEYTRIFKAGE